MRKKKPLTKKQIIVNLLREGFIDGRVWWNLMGSKFKKHEIEEIDKAVRKYSKKK